MITRKFKKFFKKAKENSKRKNLSKPKSNERKQFTGCFKCGKCYHIVKNFPLLKKEQDSEQFRNQGRKQFGNSSARRLSKAMLAAWGNATEDDEASEEEEAAVALMARSESDSDDEPVDSLFQLKGNVRGLNKAKLKELLFTLMDECDAINAENCMLKDVCSDLKKDVRKLEHVNEILKVKDLKWMKRPLFCVKTLTSLKKS